MGIYFDADIHYGVVLGDEEGYLEGLPFDEDTIDDWLREHNAPLVYATAGAYDGVTWWMLVLPDTGASVSSSHGCIKAVDLAELQFRGDALRAATEFCDAHEGLPDFREAKWLLTSSLG